MVCIYFLCIYVANYPYSSLSVRRNIMLVVWGIMKWKISRWESCYILHLYCNHNYFLILMFKCWQTLLHQELPKGKWFCCRDCNHIHSTLENLVGLGEQKLSDSLLSAIRKKHEDKASDNEAKVDIRWRVLNWKLASSYETRQLLSKAVSIFHVSMPLLH